MENIKNALVVMFDSWQFNYNACYGNDWIKTPNFDRFAREGVLFENAYGEGMPTIPVRRALHTGRYTLHETGWSPLRMEDTTIADRCWGRGIDTSIVFDCPMYRLHKYGYTRGFDQSSFVHGHEADHDYYSRHDLVHLNPTDYVKEDWIENADKIVGGNVMAPLLHEIEAYLKHRQFWKSPEDQNVCHVMKNAVEYLEKVDRNQPFFMWIDSFDPHEPWDPPSVYDPDMPCPYDPDYKGPDLFVPLMDDVSKFYTEEELHHIRMLYAEKVTLCDTYFGYLMDNFRRLGFEENTMVVLISDHGEPLGNGEHGHGIMRKCRPWPYEELVHIPLMIRAPGLPPLTRIPALVQNLDITATVCTWLGLPTDDMHSRDLWPLMTGKATKVRDFIICGFYNASLAIYTEDWMFVHWVSGEQIGKSQTGIMLMANDGNTQPLNSTQDNNIAMATRSSDLETFMEYMQTMTLDGADQWTCTPGAKLIVPQGDELYSRKTDPFQLNNIIEQHPDIAENLFRELRTFMSELKAS